MPTDAVAIMFGSCHPPRTDSPTLQDQETMLKRFKSQFGRKAKGSLTKQQDNTQPQRNSVSTEMWPADLNSNPFRDAADAPPAYSPTPNAAPAVQSPSLTVTTPADGADDPYAFLESFDTIFLIDDSGSMAGNRWRETADALETITPICTAHDGDGIDIFFLNTPDARVHHNVNSPTTVREIFQRVRPRGGTPTGQRLNQILKPYMRRFEANPEITKPINIICITDGEPSDDVESPLIAAAKKLDKLDAPAWQVGVQFFQVGRDEEAKRHLKQLDDDLAEIAGDDELRDIVDTVPFIGAEGTHLSGDGILKVVLGAVNRRLDRKKSRDLHR